MLVSEHIMRLYIISLGVFRVSVQCAMHVHGLMHVVWQLASSEAEMTSFVFRLKSVEELDHSSLMGIGSAHSIRLPKEREELHRQFQLTFK